MEGEKIGRSWWTCVKRTREKELSSFPLSISSSYPIVGFERSLSSHCYSSLRSSLLLSLLLFSSVIITWGVCTPQGLHNEMKSSSEPPESGNEPFLSHFFFDRLHSFSSSSFFSSGEGDDERYYPLSFSLTWISISALSWFIISQLPVHRVPLCLLPSSIRRNIYRQIGQAAKDIRLASVAKREKRRRLEKASLTDGSTQRRDKERREDFEREEKEDEEEKEKELERRARTAQAFLVSVRNRSIGFIHAVAISCFALACVTLDRNLTQ
ncbi:tlc domain protein, partial [Cystoisospora suis]